MHQPWASLLVYGIKRIEGRTWSTEHRGSLWIHAAGKQPSQEDIDELEAFYAQVHAAEGRDVKPHLPPSYPTSVLLGCVDVVDCLPAEEMDSWEGLPEALKQEVLSPFCFLCQNPQRLVIPQQMPGQRKLWTLPRRVAEQFAPALRPPPVAISPPMDWSHLPPPAFSSSPQK
eukprot:jgi/Astpho2/2696/Aster-x1092